MVVGAAKASSRLRRATALTPEARSSFARPAIHSVSSVSAGPPWGGLYLKPPSRGGLCEGVITIPSAKPGPVVRTPSAVPAPFARSEEHTSELQSRGHLVCRLLLEKKNIHNYI